jgi:GTP-binding protein HflX
VELFERPRKGERAVLVHVEFTEDLEGEELQEFQELVVSAGVEPVALVTGKRHHPNPKYLIGMGKAEELLALVREHEADVVLFNHTLSPAQERNLERFLNCRILDRTGLILDIFAQRARTFEGKLQVELAQLRHLSSRLVRGWTHLERQKGGIGLRGPGETQLETDRRLIGARIKQLNKRLDKVARQRDGQRQSRLRSDIATVSLVGYTNAGKSTLFNRLTGAGVQAADQLFATLDPTLRRVDLPTGGSVILADTVGFIRHLPHTLVAAFRATLEETRDACLLVHVVDAHAQNRQDCIEHVNEVLTEIEASEVPQLQVYNKIDLIPGSEPRLERDPKTGLPRRVWISAKTGAGIDLLHEALTEYGRLISTLSRDPGLSDNLPRAARESVPGEYQLRLDPAAARTRAQLYEQRAVLRDEAQENGGWLLVVRLMPAELEEILDNDGCTLDASEPLAMHA